MSVNLKTLQTFVLLNHIIGASVPPWSSLLQCSTHATHFPSQLPPFRVYHLSGSSHKERKFANILNRLSSKIEYPNYRAALTCSHFRWKLWCLGTWQASMVAPDQKAVILSFPQSPFHQCSADSLTAFPRSLQVQSHFLPSLPPSPLFILPSYLLSFLHPPSLSFFLSTLYVSLVILFLHSLFCLI